MREIFQTGEFQEWLSKLKDRRGKGQILRRLDRLAQRNPGDVRSIAKGISELQIDVGPGYRVYFTQQRLTVTFLLIGGDKSTQQQDIKRAQQLAKGMAKVS